MGKFDDLKDKAMDKGKDFANDQLNRAQEKYLGKDEKNEQDHKDSKDKKDKK